MKFKNNLKAENKRKLTQANDPFVSFKSLMHITHSSFAFSEEFDVSIVVVATISMTAD